MNFSQSDKKWMNEALKLALLARRNNEVPIGAVIVKGDNILGQGYNNPIFSNDPTSHAEINAIRNAAKKENNYRLVGTTMFVTLEPCIMCLGAIIHARIERLVYAAKDSKTDEINDELKMHYYNKLNNLKIQGGLFAEQSSCVLKDFFKSKR